YSDALFAAAISRTEAAARRWSRRPSPTPVRLAPKLRDQPKRPRPPSHRVGELIPRRPRWDPRTIDAAPMAVKCRLTIASGRKSAPSNDQGGGAEGASQRDRCRHQNAVPHDESGDVKRCHTRAVHGGNSATDRGPSDRSRLPAAA